MEVFGHDLTREPEAVRAAIGLTGQFSAIDDVLTCRENLQLMADPRLLFLDEPTTGLDPRSRRVLWQIVRELVADGVTVFLTTQYMDEADHLAVDVASWSVHLPDLDDVFLGLTCQPTTPASADDASAHRPRRNRD